MNCVPNKLITVDDRDPPWMTEKIKKLLIDKSKYYTNYASKNGRKIGVYEELLNMTNNITTKILNSKKIYFGNLAEKWPKIESEGLFTGASLSLLPTGKKSNYSSSTHKRSTCNQL